MTEIRGRKRASTNGCTPRDKFAAVLETAALNEADLSVCCRERGLYPEQIEQWGEACKEAYDWDRAQNKKLQQRRREDRQRIKVLERDLRKKEKALAETAALLVLSKKS